MLRQLILTRNARADPASDQAGYADAPPAPMWGRIPAATPCGKRVVTGGELLVTTPETCANTGSWVSFPSAAAGRMKVTAISGAINLAQFCCRNATGAIDPER